MEEVKTFAEFIKSLCSRKLLVFVVATILLIINKISQENWLIVGVAYMGVNGTIAVIEGIKNFKLKTSALIGKKEDVKNEEKEVL